MKKLLLLSGLIFWVMLQSGCSDSADGPTVSVFSNIVTFVGNEKGKVVFEYQEIDDSPIVRLGASGQIDVKKVPVGSRLLMTYSLPDGVKYGDDCGDVALRGLQTIYTDTVSALPSPTACDVEKIFLITLYRTGHYLNFTANMPALPSRKYTLRADGSTLDMDTVRLYLSTYVPEESPAYNTKQVGSVDISPVWDKPTVKAVTVHVDNSNNPYNKQFTFIKN